MKLAITGKGGVGKTTLAALLAHLFAEAGYSVVAIDADPNANLGLALGSSLEEMAKITPIAELEDLIEERTGARPGSVGGYFRLNPKVDDIPDRFSARLDGIRLLVMGTVKGGGTGCMCPENALLRALVAHLLLGSSEVVIMDMEAGLEHLARGTAEAVDAIIVVVEPGQRATQTANTIRKLAQDIGIKRLYVVGSKTHNEEERRFIAESLPDFEILGFLNYTPKAIEADVKGIGIFESDPQLVAEARAIKARLEAAYRGSKGQ